MKIILGTIPDLQKGMSWGGEEDIRGGFEDNVGNDTRFAKPKVSKR